MSWLEINKFIDFNLGIIILLIKEIKKPWINISKTSYKEKTP